MCGLSGWAVFGTVQEFGQFPGVLPLATLTFVPSVPICTYVNQYFMPAIPTVGSHPASSVGGASLLPVQESDSLNDQYGPWLNVRLATGPLTVLAPAMRIESTLGLTAMDISLCSTK